MVDSAERFRVAAATSTKVLMSPDKLSAKTEPASISSDVMEPAAIAAAVTALALNSEAVMASAAIWPAPILFADI